MSRTPSVAFRQAVYAQQTAEVPVILLTIAHADLASSICISTDNAATMTIDGTEYRGTVSNSVNYVYCPVNISLPDDSEESISKCTIEVDNVSREVLAAIRTITSAPTISMSVVLASSPDTVEASFPNFTLSDVTANALVISGTLSLGGFLGEPFPGGSMLPSNFAGLF